MSPYMSKFHYSLIPLYHAFYAIHFMSAFHKSSFKLQYIANLMGFLELNLANDVRLFYKSKNDIPTLKEVFLVTVRITGHSRVQKTLTFKTKLSAKPYL